MTRRLVDGGVVSLILWSVVAGLLGREREILAQVTAGLDEGGSLAGTGAPDTDQALRFLGDLVQLLVSGLLSGLSSATVLIMGVVTGLFILLFLMKDWPPVTNATANQIAGLLRLPVGVGRQIVSDTVQSFRSYALGQHHRADERRRHRPRRAGAGRPAGRAHCPG